MNNELIELKKQRIVAAAHSIGFVVRDVSLEGEKTIITFRKEEKPLGEIARSRSLPAVNAGVKSEGRRREP